jgi:hypothetical protein
MSSICTKTRVIGFLLLFSCLVFPAIASAQDAPAVRINRTNCENAKGSPRADELLKFLRGMPGNPAGRDDAIAACDAKVQALKKQEDDTWARANQAKNAGQCAVARQAFQQLFDQLSAYSKQAGDQLHSLNCGSTGGGDAGTSSSSNACGDASKNLQSARGYLVNVRFEQAKNSATQALSCPATADEARKLIDEIDRRQKSADLAQKAIAAVVKRDNRQACELISQIDPGYPDLGDLKKRAGDCTPYLAEKKEEKKDERPKAPQPPSDPLLADYNRAVTLAKSKPAEAERLLQKINAADKNYKDAAQLLQEVHEDSQNKDFAELEKQARNFLDKGDLQAALGKIDRAVGLKPNETRLRDFKELVLGKIAQENSDLSSGIDAYYVGKYSEAQKRLSTFMDTPHSARVLALASFYAGAASATQYYLSGQTDAAKKEEAKKEFDLSVKKDRQFTPDWAILKVSPKIRLLYLEVTGQAGQK